MKSLLVEHNNSKNDNDTQILYSTLNGIVNTEHSFIFYEDCVYVYVNKTGADVDYFLKIKS